MRTGIVPSRRPHGDSAIALMAVIPHLSWDERAARLDSWLWREARDRLSADDVTAIINRKIDDTADPCAIDAFVADGAALAARIWYVETAPESGEADPSASPSGPEPGGCHRALIALAAGGDLAASADRWLAEPRGAARIRESLTRFPGFAILALAADRSDSLYALTARDAFWSSMMGRG